MAFTNISAIIDEVASILRADAALSGVLVEVEGGVPDTGRMPYISIHERGFELDTEQSGAGRGPFNLFVDLELLCYATHLESTDLAYREKTRLVKNVMDVIHKAGNRTLNSTVEISVVTAGDPINPEREFVYGQRLVLRCTLRDTT